MATRTITLGRYTCVERLSTGPVGETWRAKRFGLVGVERQFLITKLHPALAKNATSVARLHNALKSYGELENDGLLRLIEHSGQPVPGEKATPSNDNYVVLEFQGFADLRKLWSGLNLVVDASRANALWPSLVALVGQSLAQTLADLHLAGLWHGLLSPSCIYIDLQGRVRLSDVGVAQTLSKEAWTTDPSLKPLYSYIPKEVLLGVPAGPENDVFALGVILGELLAAAPAQSEPKELLEKLRTIVDRSRAQARSDRATTMREIADALLALPIPDVQEARETLALIAEQFQLAGDTVPQAVTVSERSSAEPLPPPPGSKSGEGKVSPGPVSGKLRVATAGDKSEKSSLPPRAKSSPLKSAAPAIANTSTTAEETEDTPLPASRPLLHTNPKIPTDSPDVAGRKSVSAPPTDSKRPRTVSKDDIPTTNRARSGLDWLTSQSDQLPLNTVPETPPAEPKKVSGRTKQVSGRVQSIPPRPGEGTEVQPGTARRSNPVSINPRAGAKGTGGASANTPTAEVDVSKASSELNKAVADTGGAQNLAEAAGMIDPLSAGATNPSLIPVKIPKGMLKLGDEPTNPVSIEAVALAAANDDEPDEADSLAPTIKRRSGPISEPNPRVLTSTAPVDIVQVGALLNSGPDVLGSTGMAPAVDEVVSDSYALKPKSRTGLFIGGIAALLLAGALVFTVVSSSTQTQAVHGDAGAGEANGADGGAAVAKIKPIPADSLVLASTPAAKIYLDGQESGQTPKTLKVTAGKHKLQLIAETYVMLKREISGGTKLDLRLEQAKLSADLQGAAALKIKCKTEGTLRILVDGQDTGHTCPSDDISIAPGKHVLGFFNPATDEVKEKKLKAKAGKKPAKVKVKF